MKLDLDPDLLRMSMSMWQDATDMKIPVHDDFKIHFMANRRSLLQGFSKTAAAWITLLNSSKPLGESDLAELTALKAEVNTFRSWAERGLQEIEDMKQDRHR